VGRRWLTLPPHLDPDYYPTLIPRLPLLDGDVIPTFADTLPVREGAVLNGGTFYTFDYGHSDPTFPRRAVGVAPTPPHPCSTRGHVLMGDTSPLYRTYVVRRLTPPTGGRYLPTYKFPIPVGPQTSVLPGVGELPVTFTPHAPAPGTVTLRFPCSGAEYP